MYSTPLNKEVTAFAREGLGRKATRGEIIIIRRVR